MGKIPADPKAPFDDFGVVVEHLGGHARPVVAFGFGLSGAAQFHFGGVDGFQLDSIRVSGYSVFGVGATIAAPASTLRAPTATLASPVSTSIVNLDGLTYLAVTYSDPNRQGINDSLHAAHRAAGGLKEPQFARELTLTETGQDARRLSNRNE